VQGFGQFLDRPERLVRAGRVKLAVHDRAVAVFYSRARMTCTTAAGLPFRLIR
jgi:hypothetical protein